MSSTVLVTGAAGGIGRETAERLAERGHRVVGIDVDADGLDAVVDAVETRVCDVTDEAAVTELLDSLDELDALVHCAATYELGAVADADAASVERQFGVNVFGTLAVTRAALPTLREHGGRVVVLSSVLGRASLPLHGVYAGTKHALEGAFDALRAEESAVDVALVEPGAVDTGLNERATAALDDYADSAHAALYERVLARYDAGGVPPGDVADVVVDAVEAETPRARYVVTRQARVLLACRALLPPAAYDRVALARVRNASAARGAVELLGEALLTAARAGLARLRGRR